MSLVKRNTASGRITFHTPFPVSLLKTEELTTDLSDGVETGKSSSSSRVGVRPRGVDGGAGAGETDEASPTGPRPGTKQAWLSRSSLSRLQAKMEADNQQAREIIRPLLDTENGFMKELEGFLSRRDVTELRRRELLHKRWTERVWFPLQRRVEEHASSCCGPVEVKGRRGLYSHYLQHCNTKGFVFLETYDLREYNPFLLNIKKPHCLKLSAADFKGSLHLDLHERLREERTARSCEAGCKHTTRQAEQQSGRPLSESVMPRASASLWASSNYPFSASRNTPVESETGRRKASRLDTIPYHIRASASPDGRCRQSGCTVSSRGNHHHQQVYSNLSL